MRAIRRVQGRFVLALVATRLVVSTSVPSRAQSFSAGERFGEDADPPLNEVPPSAEPRFAPGFLDVEAGLYGGAFFPSSDHELYDSTQGFQSPYEDLGPKLGLRLGFFPFPFLGVEAEGGYGPLQNARDEQNHLFDTRGHVVVQYPWRVTPFVVAGGGFLGVDGDRGGDVDGALHWGLGAKAYLTPWLNVRLDGRHIVSAAEGPGAGNTNHFEATAGIGFVLYRRPPPPRPRASALPVVPPTVTATTSTATASKAPPPVAVEPPPQRVEVGRTLFVEAMDPVPFGFDSIWVPRRFMPVLDEIAALISTRDDLEVLIVGHADNTGEEDYNQGLSERRAEAIGQMLIDRGVPADRIRVRGEGERRPVAPNRTRDGRAMNRRTEITVQERAPDARSRPEARLETRP